MTLRNKHLNQTFKCLICEKELSTNQKLKQHISKKHVNREEYGDISLSDILFQEMADPESQQLSTKQTSEKETFVSKNDFDLSEKSIFL
jgi:hypothetical protein